MQLPTEQKRALKRKAHHLKAIVIVGQNGISPSVEMEIDRALYDHELIKIRINAESKSERLEIANTVCENLQASLVQNIGHIAILYRKSDKHKKG